VHGDGDTVGVLTGSIPHTGARSGKGMLDDFVRAQPWIGARLYGGQGAIPVRRPRDRLTDGTVALVGDAGCQVFPAHGSGIGAGMVAGKLLVDTIADGGSLDDYEHAWHRRWGGLFATYDAVRRWNQTLDGGELDEVIGLGLFDVELARAALDQQLPRVSALRLRAKARGLMSELGWARELADLAARAVAVQALYARFPRNPVARAAWSAAVARVLPV
jgi:menaquinone-9 beta-reductase